MTTAESIAVVEVSIWHRAHKTAKQWFMSNPILNSVLLLVLLIIVMSGAIVFLIMVGAIQLSDQNKEELLMEINVQILTAIFTIATIVDQPMRLRGLFYGSKFLHFYRMCQRRCSVSNEADGSNSEGEGAGASVKLMQNEERLDNVAVFMRKYFDWMMYRVSDDNDMTDLTSVNAAADLKQQSESTSHHLEMVNSSNNREINQIGDSKDTIGRIRPWTDYSCVDIRGFMIAMVAFNISTIGQTVVSVYMFCIHPYSQRPNLPIAIFAPIAFLGAAIGGIYQGYQKYQMQKYLKNSVITTSSSNASRSSEINITVDTSS